MNKLEMIIIATSEDIEKLDAFIEGLHTILKNPPEGIFVEPLETKHRILTNEQDIKMN